MSRPFGGPPNPYAPPTASLEHDGSALHAPAGFRSPKALAQTITVLLAMYIVVQVVHIAHLAAAIQAMYRVLAGVASESVEAAAIDRRMTVINGLPALTYLPAAVLFCMFVFRANKNLRALDLIHPQFSPGWAVGVFFIPIWNFYKPYQVMREIWEGSTPDPDAVVVASSLRGPPLLKWWWGLYVASFIHVQVFDQRAGASALIWRAEKALAGNVVNLVAAVLAIAVVRGVAARQDARQRLRAAPLT